MPQLPKPPRRQLKIEPTREELLAVAARSLSTIAEKFSTIVETLDALVVEDEFGRKCLRMAKE
jgi:hypothetical protein